jgi:predicted transposase YbfD/YdcC
LDLDNADYIRETLNLPDCRIVVRVDRQLSTDDGTIVLDDTRFFITSLDPDQVSAYDILRHVRNHWRVENCLHFTKDRWWDEDRHYTRRPGLSALMAAINNAAISIHRILSDPRIPLRAAADYIQWKPTDGINMLAK